MIHLLTFFRKFDHDFCGKLLGVQIREKLNALFPDRQIQFSPLLGGYVAGGVEDLAVRNGGKADGTDPPGSVGIRSDKTRQIMKKLFGIRLDGVGLYILDVSALGGDFHYTTEPEGFPDIQDRFLQKIASRS